MKISKIYIKIHEVFFFKGWGHEFFFLLRYWNPGLKQEFLQRTMGLWKDYAAEPITHQEKYDRAIEEQAALSQANPEVKKIK